MAPASETPLPPLDGWALILGASSGFGAAAATTLARAGVDIIGVHLDRRSTMPNVERIMAEIRERGREA
jgi:NADP-dependent 3-hydroxy acid dehydrogenase YdfG